MNQTLFYVCAFGLQIICLIVGALTSKNIQSRDDYFLAGKTIRFFPLMMTFLATQVGGGLVLGSAEEAYQFGWAVLFYPLGASLGLILLGLGIGRRLAEFNVSTVAQIFETVYGSTHLRKGASLLSIVSLFMILIAQIIASSKFMISIGFDSTFGFCALWALVIIYTAAGGMRAVISTDIVQASFFIGIFALCFGIALFSPQISLSLPSTFSHFNADATKLYGWLMMPLMFMVIEQDMGQRCFAAEAPKVVSKATLWAGVCTLAVCVIPVFFGVLAKEQNLAIPQGASVLMEAIRINTNPVMAAVVGAAIIAAIISTADSLINAISSNISQDFGRQAPLRVAQGLAALISAVAIASSFYFTNIVDLLIQSYELSVSCLFISILFALFKKEGNRLSATLSILFGAAGFFLFRYYPTELPKEFLGVFLSLTGFALGELYCFVATKYSMEAETQ